MKKSLFFTHLVVFLSLSTISWCSFAKVITLYDQPKADAKSVGTIDLAAGIIPIYTPKDGAWIKVADPKNGHVGWVKSSILNDDGMSQSVFTFTQGLMNDGTGPSTYRIIQYGQPKSLTQEQAQAMMKKMQMQQQSIHQAVQKSMDNMFRDINLFNNGYPFMMPVLVFPVPESSHVSQPAVTTNTQTLPNTR